MPGLSMSVLSLSLYTAALFEYDRHTHPGISAEEQAAKLKQRQTKGKRERLCVYVCLCLCLCVGLLSILNFEASQLKRIVRWHFTSYLTSLSLHLLRSLSLVFREKDKGVDLE